MEFYLMGSKLKLVRQVYSYFTWTQCNSYFTLCEDQFQFTDFFKISLKMLSIWTQYCTGDKIEKNEMGGACSAVGGGEVYRALVGKPEGKRPLGRPRRRWEDNIKMDLQELGCGVMDWIELADDRDRWRELVNAVMNLRDL
jgi:hypothetical protein